MESKDLDPTPEQLAEARQFLIGCASIRGGENFVVENLLDAASDYCCRLENAVAIRELELREMALREDGPPWSASD